MNQAGLQRLLFELTDLSANRLTPTPSCVPLSRFRTAVLRENWTPAEMKHLEGCTCCRDRELLAKRNSWHPMPFDFFLYLHGKCQEARQDVAYHLKQDRCQRCVLTASLLAADRFLRRHAGRPSPALDRLLSCLSVAVRINLPTSKSELVISAEENADVTFAWTGRGRFHLKATHGFPSPTLMHLQLQGEKTNASLFLVTHSVGEGFAVEGRFNDVPRDPAILLLYPVHLTFLGKEDLKLLQDSYACACQNDVNARAAWQTWAKRSVKQGLLDADLNAQQRLWKDAPECPKP